jgi:hypothetical protein
MKKRSRKQVDDAISRTKRQARLVTIRGWDSEEEATGFYGRFSFHPTIPDHKRVAIHDYIVMTPARWEIEAHIHLKFANGESRVDVWEGVTEQAITAPDTLEVRKLVREEACRKINPRFIQDVAYKMRLAR